MPEIIGAGPVVPPSTESPPRNELVRSLTSGMKVLESFAEAGAVMTLSEVARRTGLTRATARRMLRTLVHLGYASTDGSTFSLTPKVLTLGLGFWAGKAFSDLLQPALQRLSQDLGESCSASALDGEDIIYIARVHTRRIMRMDLEVGTRLPAFATSMGRVLLSDLDAAQLRRTLATFNRPRLTPTTITGVDALAAVIIRAREDGYTLVDQELEAGLRSVSVPVNHPERGIIAAINVSVSAGLESADDSLQRVLPCLQQCAGAAAEAVQAWENGTGRTWDREIPRSR